jgi:hypothetical protein
VSKQLINGVQADFVSNISHLERRTLSLGEQSWLYTVLNYSTSREQVRADMQLIVTENDA